MFWGEKKMFWEEAKPEKNEYENISSSQLQVCFHRQEKQAPGGSQSFRNNLGWRSFLDTQVSLAPTHVSKLVTLSDFQSLVSNGRSNKKKFKKQSAIIF